MGFGCAAEVLFLKPNAQSPKPIALGVLAVWRTFDWNMPALPDGSTAVKMTVLLLILTTIL